MNKTNLTRENDGGERRHGLRTAGTAASQIVGAIVTRHGGGVVARLKSEWAAIVGPELATACWPESLSRGGRLKLRVAPVKALEIQHRAPLVIERINSFFGRDAVIRLTLIQGPLPLPPSAKPALARPLGMGEASALDRQLATVDDPALRQALDRLGHAVIGAAER
jgi:hypothetical protein